MKDHPKSVYLLNFISMWEAFSYYGVRALLILFLIHKLDFTDSNAFVIYTAYTTVVEFGGVIGGIIADRFLGLKRAIFLGGWIIVVGHTILSFCSEQYLLFLGLFVLTTGSSLFRANICALLGTFYKDDHIKRESGYTFYYTGINGGAFLATIFCGFVGETYGWHAGFGLAAFTMLLGNIALWLGKDLLFSHEESRQKSKSVDLQAFFSEKGLIKKLSLYVLFFVVFFGCEEQLGSTLVLFTERHVDRFTAFGTIPASLPITLNTLTILIVGGFFAHRLQRLLPGTMRKITLSFVLLALSYFILYFACQVTGSQSLIPLSYVVTSLIIMAVGELLIGPTIFAAAAKAAPPSVKGFTMGIVTIGISIANCSSGFLSQFMAISDHMPSLGIYSHGFWVIGSICFVTAFCIFAWMLWRSFFSSQDRSHQKLTLESLESHK